MNYNLILKAVKVFRKELAPNWCVETAYHSVNESAGINKSTGQCVVSAMLLAERLAEKIPDIKIKIALGEVLDTNGNILIDNHGWVEVLGDDCKKWNIDITLDQSDVKLPVYFDLAKKPKNTEIIYTKKKYLGKISASLEKRFLLLKSRLYKYEEHFCNGCELPIDKYLQLGSDIGRHLLAVGESPADKGWRKSGRAFFTVDGKIVPTGKNFLINLKQINEALDLENISFTEISKCFIGNNRNKLRACALKTWPHFIEQLNYIQPRLIVLLGKETTAIFNFLTGSLLEVGHIQQIDLSEKKYSILPLYHPSPLNPRRVQNIGFINDNIEEIRKLLEIK